MPLVNTTEVIDRHNRPAVNSRVMLRSFFLNDGQYTDPYAVSSVHVFNRSLSLSPSSVIGSDGMVLSGSTSAAAMVFKPTGNGIVGSDDSLKPDTYTGDIPEGPYLEGAQPCSGASGVYRLAKGEFASVLNGFSAPLSGIDQNANPIANSASAAIRYFDIWTVKMTAGSQWTTFINEFELFDDTFLTSTEPLLLRAKNTLFNRQVALDSITAIKVGTEITIENRNIDEALKNIIKDGVVVSATMSIVKMNDDPNLPARVPVVLKTCEVTAGNTLIYNFDTTKDLQDGNGVTSFDEDDLGGRRGTYGVKVIYPLLSEKIVSPWMYFIVK